MGDKISKEEKKEKQILRSPNVGEASDLYWASRSGDVDAVRQILATTSFNDLNHLEPNGSTALHAAACFGHADVVRILLQERGVMRNRKNRYGFTAYEEAPNDEIRQLFHRPNSNRFCSDSTDDNEDIFNFTSDEVSEDDEDKNQVTDAWVKEYDNDLEIKALKTLMQMVKLTASSPILRWLLLRVSSEDFPDGMDTKRDIINPLEELINKCVISTHPDYDKVCMLFSNYRETRNPEYLLRLYSLETPFYRQIKIDKASEYLLTPLLIGLNSLKARMFRGCTYRGQSMAKNNLRPYQRCLRRKGSIIWNKSFCSTSVDEAVARRFIPTSYNDELNVLIVFNFPQACDMAIQLCDPSGALPCISDFEDEREVLILPATMFHVINITNENSSNQYTLYLENVLPKLHLMATIAAGRSGNWPDTTF